MKPLGHAALVLGVLAIALAGLASLLAAPTPTTAQTQSSVGRGMTLTDLGNSTAFLQWGGGTATNLTLVRSTASGNTSTSLANTATTAVGPVPAGEAVACWQLFAEPGGSRSDIVCLIANIQAALDLGASAVGLSASGLTVAANESNTLTAIWTPAPGGTAQIFLPLGTPRLQILGGGVNFALDNTGGGPTCVLILTLLGATHVGTSNGACVIVGQSFLPPPAATPTRTNTPFGSISPTGTSSPTASRTSTPSASPTNTPGASPTVTPTRTSTLTPQPIVTPCAGCLTIITTEFAPLGVAVNSVTNRAYVAGEQFDRVHVIDGATNTILTAILNLGAPAQVAVNSTTNRTFVAANTGVLHIIDGVTNTVVSAVPLPATACNYAVAANSTTNRVYATASVGCGGPPGRLMVIDGTSGAVIVSLDLAVSGIGGVAVNPLTNRFYLAATTGLLTFDGATNTLLSTTVLDFHALSASPNRIAVNTVTNRAYVSSDIASGIVVVDLTTNATLAFIPGVGGGDFDVAVSTTTNRVYTSNGAGGLVVIDAATNTIRTVVDLQGNTAFGIAVNPVTNRVYMTERNQSRTLVLLDAP